ncbi:Molydopterin dinucleotide binding domain protein [uncultured archaeon]|nr:Molydopterin dinucleotide binding domain protein [uncultured archaeon]
MALEVTVITVRDIFQDEAAKKGRFTDEYQKLSAQIILDKQDMAKLGAKDGQSLQVQNAVGSIVVAARTGDDDPHPGIAFMNSSPWANQLVGDDICSAKNIKASVSPSNENVTVISEILQRIRS